MKKPKDADKFKPEVTITDVPNEKKIILPSRDDATNLHPNVRVSQEASTVARVAAICAYGKLSMFERRKFNSDGTLNILTGEEMDQYIKLRSWWNEIGDDRRSVILDIIDLGAHSVFDLSVFI